MEVLVYAMVIVALAYSGGVLRWLTLTLLGKNCPRKVAQVVYANAFGKGLSQNSLRHPMLLSEFSPSYHSLRTILHCFQTFHLAPIHTRTAPFFITHCFQNFRLAPIHSRTAPLISSAPTKSFAKNGRLARRRATGHKKSARAKIQAGDKRSATGCTRSAFRRRCKPARERAYVRPRGPLAILEALRAGNWFDKLHRKCCRPVRKKEFRGPGFRFNKCELNQQGCEWSSLVEEIRELDHVRPAVSWTPSGPRWGRQWKQSTVCSEEVDTVKQW